MEKLKVLLAFLRSLPAWSRIAVIIAAALAAIALSSCTRSAMRFKGTGEVEYEYKGVNGPELSTSR